MTWSNFILTLRVLYKQRVYTLINLFGLSVGLAGAFILILFVLNEVSYNRYNLNLDNIYRINSESTIHNMAYARTPYILGETLRGDLPEDVKTARTFNISSCSIFHDNQLFREEGIVSAENDIFDILTFKVLGGNQADFLVGPNSAVITRSIARKYFGDEYPVGRSLTLENNGTRVELNITGLIEDLPLNSTFRPDIMVNNELALDQMNLMITSSSNEPLPADLFATSWDMHIFFKTYLLIPPGYPVSSVEKLLHGYEKEYYKEDQAVLFKLQKYSDIYLGTELLRADDNKGDRKSVYIYSVIALLLLLTASLNYILLSTAVMGSRGREMGLKMLNGASRRAILMQILSENILFSIAAMIIGITIAEITLPEISNILFGKIIAIDYAGNILFSLSVVVISLLIGLFSGLYLATVVSKGNPYDILMNRLVNRDGKPLFARILNALQLVISITLLVCTGIIYSQLSYFRRADTGFDINNVISIDIGDDAVRKSYDLIKERIMAIPGVENISGSMWAPPTGSNMSMNLKRVDNPEERVNLEGLMVDYNFIATLGLRLIEGEDFDPAKGSSARNLVINKKAIGALGIEGSPLGVTTSFGTITGVVEDFHIHSFHQVVPPMVIQFMPQGVRVLLVRLKPGSGPVVLDDIRAAWEEVSGGRPMEYTFLSDALADLYSQERRFATILLIFSALTMVVALLGIFGMASLNTERRTREVGIRKVMGAESGEILGKFAWEYSLLTIISMGVAFPLGYWLMTRWLSNFEFHGSISPLIFVISAIVAVTIVLGTVAWQVTRAANTNPLDSIRYE